MITVIPSGGLCDRLMTIESVISLAKQLKESKITLIWKLNNELNCPFEELLQPIQNIVVKNVADNKPKKKTLLSRIINRSKKIWRKYVLLDEIVNLIYLSEKKQLVKNEEICTQYFRQRKKITIQGFGQFCIDDAIFYRLFKLSGALEKDLLTISSLFPLNIIGVHIRRTDNVYAISESPTSLFVEKMNAEIVNNPDTNFYVASDSLEELNHLIELFGDRIWYQKNCIRERTSIDGMKCAILDLYALAATKTVWGSYWSVYSYTAAKIGAKEFLSIYRQSNNHNKDS